MLMFHPKKALIFAENVFFLYPTAFVKNIYPYAGVTGMSIFTYFEA